MQDAIHTHLNNCELRTTVKTEMLIFSLKRIGFIVCSNSPHIRLRSSIRSNGLCCLCHLSHVQMEAKCKDLTNSTVASTEYLEGLEWIVLYVLFSVSRLFHLTPSSTFGFRCLQLKKKRKKKAWASVTSVTHPVLLMLADDFSKIVLLHQKTFFWGIQKHSTHIFNLNCSTFIALMSPAMLATRLSITVALSIRQLISAQERQLHCLWT